MNIGERASFVEGFASLKGKEGLPGRGGEGGEGN